LKASRANLVFQFYVAQRRLPHFVELVLDEAPDAAFLLLLSQISSLNRLERLTLTRQGYSTMFGRSTNPAIFASPYSLGFHSRTALRTLSQRLKHLRLIGLADGEIGALIGILDPSLPSLRLTYTSATAEPGRPQRVVDALLKLSGLKHLHISTPYSSNSILDLSALNAALATKTPGKPLPPVETLTISTLALHSSVPSFSQHFASTLLTLNLVTHTRKCEEEDEEALDRLEDFEQPRFQQQIFPLVHSLTLIGSASYTEETLKSMDDSAFPALRSLAYDGMVRARTSTAFPQLLFDKHRHLAALHIPTLYDLYAVAWARQYCHERKISLSTSPTAYSPPLSIRYDSSDYRYDLRTDASDDQRRRSAYQQCDEAVVDLLNFLGRRLSYCRANFDVGEIARLATMLRDVGVEKAAMRM
jgi:hypothetical protein